jgi:zinc/manganese transport system substrate-binding protein
MRPRYGFRVFLSVALACSVLGCFVQPAGAAGKLRVVATISDLKALAEAVGADEVTVDVLARGNQNPHDLEVRPSLMVKLRQADALVMNGLELDEWANVAVQGSGNPRIIAGGIGLIDASRGIPVLEVPAGRVDRSMGDVHPSGNPHYTLDPGMAPIVTQNLVDGFTRVAPDRRPAFERNRQAFLNKLQEAMARWTQGFEPFKGAKVVVYHADWVYFFTRFGLRQAGTIEERPGIPATPGHLAQLIRQMKEEQVKAVVCEPWSDQPLATRVAQDAGATLALLNATLGTQSGPDAYLHTTDANVAALLQALR